MKKVLKGISIFLISLLLISGFVYLVFIISSYIFDTFSSLEKEISAGIIAASATILVSVITVVIGKHLEKKKEIEHQLRIQKTEIYEKYMEKMFQVLTSGQKFPEKEMTKYFGEFSRKLILWGGKKVIKSYCDFRIFGTQELNNKDKSILLYFEKVLFEIRRDLGNSNRNLKQGDLLTLFIKDPSEIKDII